jgi:1-acyl-sn-glycerol-3-phosphate acyltransferase
MAVRELGFIHVFPEGECYRGSQEIRPFHPGAFLLACRLALPVVPVTLVLHQRRGRATISILGRTVRLPPQVTVVIGKPLPAPLALVQADTDHTSPASTRRAARELAVTVRQVMQDTIDRKGGCKTMDRGQMPRLVRQA